MIFITDIDGTLLGDTAGLDMFNRYFRPLRQQVKLIYASGRNYDECMDAIKNGGLLYPDAIIASTGADIYIKKNGSYVLDLAWHGRLSSSGWDKSRLQNALSRVEGISPQQVESDFKISYFISMASQEEIRNRAAVVLSEGNLDAKLIASHGLYLDVLPAGCDKGEAALYLLEKMGAAVEDTLVAGDSENDADLFIKFKHGVIVGNAHQGLRDMLKGSDHYEAKNECAAGVLEGMKYYINTGIFKF
jgi:sucrose-6F-phosphate phosphohydrolase